LDGLDERDSPCAEVNHAIYLSDAEWALLESLPPKSHKSERVNDRKIVNAMLYELRTGTPRRDLPARYGSALPAVASIPAMQLGSRSTPIPFDRIHGWIVEHPFRSDRNMQWRSVGEGLIGRYLIFDMSFRAIA
jgi:transposase